ncbi:MAG: tRNA 4-thiouridine(8) synthase ThiI [Candidatus Aenigmarchaeota archaeon]|nr:tRNA 4-thiouridine(8) synthase ThiI [Candidatus Aenigmarchaeota archaeon]
MPILVHYSEIGTKGGNRPFFENKLVENIRKSLGARNSRRLYGKILVEAEDSKDNQRILQHIPGIAHFSPCRVVGPKLDEIRGAVLGAAKKSRAKTFKIESSRSDKAFAYNSLQMNNILGECVRTKTKKKVKLENPALTIFVEVDAKQAFVYTEKIRGIGGLPVGTAGKVVCLLSGGIDSPVAAYSLMKRGCEVIFVHFYNYDEKAKQAKKRKIEEIVKTLNKFQLKSRLYMIPFLELQAELVKHVPPRYRMLIYRRFMFKIAEEIMRSEGAKGFVTGDNIAQVASQTLENLNVIYEATRYPVFAPLIGMNKNEIIEIAEHIGTYKTSILPYEDCCTFLVAKHPETRATIEEIREMESVLEIESMIKDAMKRADVNAL